MRLGRLIRRRGDTGFDIVHVHGPLPSVLARLASLPRSSSPSVVTTSHTPWTSLRVLTRLGWWLTERLDAATIAVSAAVAASLPAHARRGAIVVPHGIDERRIHAALASTGEPARTASSPSVDEADDNRTDHVTVISVASHRDAKNYPNLLHGVRAAVDRGAPLHLVAIGEGPNLVAHRQLSADLGLSEIVTFAAPSDDVLTDIAGADILVVASDYEGQPIVVAEALALGVPVVATAVGRVPEMVNTSVGRIVAPRDPAALGAALAELATSPALRAEMSAAARRDLHAWTLDDVVAAHLAIYLDVVAGSPRGRPQ
jgi:glycosyltransferase involved in cell wall biosynthesis